MEGARRIGKSTAVEAFLTTNNFTQVDLVKRDILKLYENDFMKFDSTGRASLLFDHIPAELQKNASRYQVSSVIENARAGTMLERISKLQDSKTVNVAYHANAPEAGLSQNIDLEKFKLFVCDTGLFVTLCFKDKDFTEKFSKYIGSRFLVYTKEYRKDTDIFCISMYLVPFI